MQSHWITILAFTMLPLSLVPLMFPLQMDPVGIAVVINEVELNPPGQDGDTGSEEWVELYNPSDQAVDVSGWKLEANRSGAVIEIPQDTLVDVKTHLVISAGSQHLGNVEESVSLVDADEIVVDSTPVLNDTVTSRGDSGTWQRFPDGQDTDSDEDWLFREATPQYENIPGLSQTTPVIGIAVGVSLSVILLRHTLRRNRSPTE